MSRFELGQRVALSGTVEKVRDRVVWRPKISQNVYSEAKAAWDEIKAEHGRSEYGMLRTRLIESRTGGPVVGVIVGKRTIQQGVTESYSYDEPNCFLPCESSQVWLVAFHLRRKPVMCFDHQLTEVTS